MKKAIVCILSAVCLFPFAASAQEQARVTVDMPNGKNSCLLVDNALVDCVPVEPLREIIQTSAGAMSCIVENGSYVDCQMVGDAAAVSPSASEVSGDAMMGVEAGVDASGAALPENANPADMQPVEQSADMNAAAYGDEAVYSEPIPVDAVAPEDNPAYVPPEQPAVGQTVSEPAESSGSRLGYWNNDYGIATGLVYGLSLGWFGLVSGGSLEENGFAFGLNLGYKGVHFGVSFDCDFSVSPTEEKFHDLWTYSFSGLLMTHWPIVEGIAQTIGFGVGYTGWSLDYEYTTRTLAYNWFDGYYVREDDYSTTVDSGGFLSLKLKTRLDFYLDDLIIGFEFDWIPWLDTDRNGKIVNNIVGIQLYIGGFM